MLLEDIKLFYDQTVDYIKRNRHTFDSKYCSGMLYGTFRAIKDALIHNPIEDLPILEPITAEDIGKYPEDDTLQLINKINIFGTYYPIYLDDYGQSMGTYIDNEYISFGTYNSEVEFATVNEVFSNIYHKDLVQIIKEGDENEKL